MQKICFSAMASHCEVHVEDNDKLLCQKIFQTVMTEAHRIERKFSRYRSDSVLSQIHQAKGKAFEVDPETAQLINYAYTCYDLSDGLIDITTGILRKIWRFTPESVPPTEAEITEMLPRIGLHRAKWTPPYFQLPKNMEIDFGGIGKEYAVDRCLALASQMTKQACLVNFGGDLAANKAPRSGFWKIGIEDTSDMQLFTAGGIATSGNTKKFLIYDGQVHSHILNPKTGRALQSPLATITVMAGSCTEAGIIATLSHLQRDPERFLKEQGVSYWIKKFDLKSAPMAHNLRDPSTLPSQSSAVNR